MSSTLATLPPLCHPFPKTRSNLGRSETIELMAQQQAGNLGDDIIPLLYLPYCLPSRLLYFVEMKFVTIRPRPLARQSVRQRVDAFLLANPSAIELRHSATITQYLARPVRSRLET